MSRDRKLRLDRLAQIAPDVKSEPAPRKARERLDPKDERGILWQRERGPQ